ncbi:hypothetical protein [Mycolicibacterium sp. CH28]|uniref:putative alpha/beta hydrolase n=1 Tax=Mycolicibacterium sp. CH28 TaxID=2512237 RepID=UPI001F2E316E|nr:hypothetical protein [Mycolicibacterium sp. CH28]
MVQQDQLPAIGTDLTDIAANLAETQRFSGMQVENLNTQLHYIDALIGQALTNDQDTSALEDNAIAATSGVLHKVEALRDDYSAKLETSLTDLRAEHGYDPAPIEDVDGDSELGPEQRGRESTDWYEANQQTKDEVLANSSGPMTQEKADAAARLRDFAATGDPAAAPDARRLAGERLDDFRMAHFVGPLPKDPILGGDARSRARSRLDLQHQLEQGLHGLPPMPADQATQALDEGEQFGRVVAVKEAVHALTSQGMSPEGAAHVVNNLVEYGGLTATGAERYASSIPTGRHSIPSALSAADAQALAKIAGRIGRVGDVVELGMAFNDWFDGGTNEDLGSAIGGTTGGAAGAWAAGTGAAMFAGPWTAAVVAVVGAVACGAFGERIGGGIGSYFDPKIASSGGGGSSW